MSEIILNMYVVAVESGRFTIGFVPKMYRQAVADILGIELEG